MNIDTLVESFYSKKDETESIINEVLSLLLTEQTTPTSESFDWNAIPELHFGIGLVRYTNGGCGWSTRRAA